MPDTNWMTEIGIGEHKDSFLSENKFEAVVIACRAICRTFKCDDPEDLLPNAAFHTLWTNGRFLLGDMLVQVHEQRS
jgi:hypothetical protein